MLKLSLTGKRQSSYGSVSKITDSHGYMQLSRCPSWIQYHFSECEGGGEVSN
jgi:hypothetical protein